MSFTQPIANTTNPTVHFHTGVFTPTKNGCLLAVGAAGSAVAAVGIIALFIIQGVPTPAAYAILGVGGGIVVADAIALVYLIVKHQRDVGLMKAYVSNENFENLFSEMQKKKTSHIFTAFEAEFSDTDKTNYGKEKIFVELDIANEQRSFHLFWRERDCFQFLEKQRPEEVWKWQEFEEV
jgi:hypothetical protein